MKHLISIEELAMFGLSIFVFHLTGIEWWWYPALILAPDVGILGYLAGSKVGAITYNIFHHKAIAILLVLFGWHFTNDWILLSGIIMFGHSSLDRLFGYGLKYPDNFKHTHLGWLNHQKDAEE